MGYLVLEAILFGLGFLAFVVATIPLSRRRVVRHAAARVVGVLLMIPLPLYLIACKQSHLSPLGTEDIPMDPLMVAAQGFAHLIAIASAFACCLAATVFAIVTSELRPRDGRK